MNNEETYYTKSFEQTKLLGEEFVSRSGILLEGTKSPIVIAFYGDLGSGKTTFIQGLSKGLDIKRRIISPTFIIVRNYKIKKGNFYHIDLYRTQNMNDLLSVGLDEILGSRENIVAIEWAEKLGKLLPDKRIDVHFEYIDESKRKITIKKYE